MQTKHLRANGPSQMEQCSGPALAGWQMSSVAACGIKEVVAGERERPDEAWGRDKIKLGKKAAESR